MDDFFAKFNIDPRCRARPALCRATGAVCGGVPGAGGAAGDGLLLAMMLEGARTWALGSDRSVAGSDRSVVGAERGGAAVVADWWQKAHVPRGGGRSLPRQPRGMAPGCTLARACDRSAWHAVRGGADVTRRVRVRD
eukprot:6171990-Pleurochrysis_carterae.AAC.1